jgi:hypothetical protein
MTDAAVKVIGKSVPLMALLGFMMGIMGLVWTAGQVYAKVQSTGAQADKNASDILELQKGFIDLQRGQSELNKNMDRVITKLDELLDRK